MFTTVSPCLMCAKLMINAGFSGLYYHEPYRKKDGLQALIKFSSMWTVQL